MDTTKEPIAITDANFDEVVLKSTVPVMVDVWATWCGPCRMIAPHVEQIASEYAGRVLVAKLDADANQRIMARYQIFGIPTLLFFKNGNLVERQTGALPKANIVKKLEKVLATN